jgi:hypothetical protein
LEDLDVRGLIWRGETRKRMVQLYGYLFSELRRVLEWEFEKRGKHLTRCLLEYLSRVFPAWWSQQGFDVGDCGFRSPAMVSVWTMTIMLAWCS